MIVSSTSTEGYILNAQRIAEFYPLLSESEKQALEQWEAAHVQGDRRLSPSDWPGWPAVFKRLSH
jgi:hypothetical protein